MSYQQTIERLLQRLAVSNLPSSINNALGDVLDRDFIRSITPSHERVIREELIRVGVIGRDTNVLAYLEQRIQSQEDDIFAFLDTMNAIELADDTWSSSWEQHDRQQARRRVNGPLRAQVNISQPNHHPPLFRQQVQTALRDLRRRQMERRRHSRGLNHEGRRPRS